jgi:hypothetical protein
MKQVVKFVVIAASLVAAGAGRSQASPIVFQAAGADAASITPTVNNFRNALGAQNPNVVGSLGTGRREVNWDGVPNNLAAPNAFPGDFFNVNSPRGVVFSTPGTRLEVSANAASGNPIEFDDLNPGNSALFAPFSAPRLFTAVGSFINDTNFFVPGTNFPAFSRGFGAIFTDVDAANTTSLEFFDIAGHSLGLFFVPPAVGNETFSFLGVQFTEEMIGRVRITSGSAGDAVAMDDFIYAEPNPVPEPTTCLLTAAGLGVIAKRVRARRKSA